MMDLDLGIISEAEKRSKKKLLLDYLYGNLKNHNFWAYRYFFCEFLALSNVIGKSLLNAVNALTLVVLVVTVPLRRLLVLLLYYYCIIQAFVYLLLFALLYHY